MPAPSSIRFVERVGSDVTFGFGVSLVVHDGEGAKWENRYAHARMLFCLWSGQRAGDGTPRFSSRLVHARMFEYFLKGASLTFVPSDCAMVVVNFEL